ncbi:hypothetical protein FACS189468_0330 [Spirochaetia bacterium]|nr:hypothetical protein FACS189468_0330 [Spirochaetia bacterium]
MLMTEWNWDTAKEVWYEEGREEGEKKVRELVDLVRQGYTAEQIEAQLSLKTKTVGTSDT